MLRFRNSRCKRCVKRVTWRSGRTERVRKATESRLAYTRYRNRHRRSSHVACRKLNTHCISASRCFSSVSTKPAALLKESTSSSLQKSRSTELKLSSKFRSSSKAEPTLKQDKIYHCSAQKSSVVAHTEMFKTNPKQIPRFLAEGRTTAREATSRKPMRSVQTEGIK